MSESEMTVVLMRCMEVNIQVAIALERLIEYLEEVESTQPEGEPVDSNYTKA